MTSCLRLKFAVSLLLSWLAVPSGLAQGAGAITAPGSIVSSPDGTRIVLDPSRSLLWKQASVTLLDARGQSLQQIDLAAKGKKESGVEALGLEVEEADLGGSMRQKSYLSGKKKPQGRAFDKGALTGGAAIGDKKESAVDGVKMTVVTYPNGASEWSFLWPNGDSETHYFDKRRSVVVSELNRSVGGMQYQLKQWAEGSYLRHYSNESGAVSATYDARDPAAQIEFFNRDGERLTSLTCQATCSKDSE